MMEKKPIKPIDIDVKDDDQTINRNHLKFFIERSSETIERTLNIVQNLQKEINQLKDGLSKADNEFRNLDQTIHDNKKSKN